MSHKDETPGADNDSAFCECGFWKWEHGGYYGLNCPKREGVFTMIAGGKICARVTCGQPEEAAIHHAHNHSALCVLYLRRLFRWRTSRNLRPSHPRDRAEGRKVG